MLINNLSGAPAKLKADFQAFFTSAVPVGTVVKPWASGSLTKIDANSATYRATGIEPVTFTKNDDPELLAQHFPAIAAQWRQEYGYIPPVLVSTNYSTNLVPVETTGNDWQPFESQSPENKTILFAAALAVLFVLFKRSRG